MQCDQCKWRARVQVNRAARRGCLRHRLDGAVHVLPPAWLRILESGEAGCDIYAAEPTARKAA